MATPSVDDTEDLLDAFKSLRARPNGQIKVTKEVQARKDALAKSPDDPQLLWDLSVEYLKNGLVDRSFNTLIRGLPTIRTLDDELQKKYALELCRSSVSLGTSAQAYKRWESLGDNNLPSIPEKGDLAYFYNLMVCNALCTRGDGMTALRSFSAACSAEESRVKTMVALLHCHTDLKKAGMHELAREQVRDRVENGATPSGSWDTLMSMVDVLDNDEAKTKIKSLKPTRNEGIVLLVIVFACILIFLLYGFFVIRPRHVDKSPHLYHDSL